MPVIYQGTCNNCGYTTAMMSAGYGAVLVDGKAAEQQSEVAGVVTFGNTADAIAEVSDSRFVVLAHPIESSILAKTGYTWNDLFRQGRYVQVTNVICRQCGNVFAKRRLRAPGAIGCLTTFWCGVAGGTIVGLIQRNFFEGLLAFFGVILVLSFLIEQSANLYIRRRYSARAAALAAESACQTCHANDSQPINNKIKGYPCPACKRASLAFKSVGIS